MQENEQRPQPEGESRPQLEREERSAGQVALQALDTFAIGLEYGAGIYVAKETVAPVVEKVKDALKPGESTIELPPGTEK
jgi:hypothetical protein